MRPTVDAICAGHAITSFVKTMQLGESPLLHARNRDSDGKVSLARSIQQTSIRVRYGVNVTMYWYCYHLPLNCACQPLASPWRAKHHFVKYPLQRSMAADEARWSSLQGSSQRKPQYVPFYYTLDQRSIINEYQVEQLEG